MALKGDVAFGICNYNDSSREMYIRDWPNLAEYNQDNWDIFVGAIQKNVGVIGVKFTNCRWQ